MYGESSDADKSIKYLVNKHKDIECIKIRVSKLTDKALGYILSLAKVRTVAIEYTGSGITGKELSRPHNGQIISGFQRRRAQPRASQIQQLSLKGCWRINGLGLANILKFINGDILTELDITGVSALQEGLHVVDSLPSTFASLRVLKLGENRDISSSLVGLLNKIVGDLEEFHLNDVGFVTFENFNELTKSFPRMRALVIKRSRITDTGLVRLFNKIGDDLEELHIHLSFSLTLRNLDDLNVSFKKLRFMKITCKKLEFPGIAQLCNRVGDNLEELDLFFLYHTMNNYSLRASFNRVRRVCLPAVDPCYLLPFLRHLGDNLAEIGIYGNLYNPAVLATIKAEIIPNVFIYEIKSMDL